MKDTLNEVFGMDFNQAKEALKKFDFEKIKMKFLLVMPYFLPFGDLLTYFMATIRNFDEIASKLGFELDDLKVFLNMIGVVISNAKFKQLKNRILERIDLLPDKLTDEDKDLFFVTPYFENISREVGKEDLLFNQVDQALVLFDFMWSKIYMFGNEEYNRDIEKYDDEADKGKRETFGKGLDKFIELVQAYNYNELIESVIKDFFMERLKRKAGIIEKMDYTKGRLTVIDKTAKQIYEYVLRDLNLIELNLEYKLNWIELFSEIYRRISEEQKQYERNIIHNEMQSLIVEVDKKVGVDTDSVQVQSERRASVVASLKQSKWGSLGKRVMAEIEHEEKVLQSYFEKLREKVREIRGLS